MKKNLKDKKSLNMDSVSSDEWVDYIENLYGIGYHNISQIMCLEEVQLLYMVVI